MPEDGVEDAGDAEVREDGVSFGVEEDVLGLEVGVDDAVGVAAREGRSDLPIERERPFGRGRVERDLVREGASVPDEVHDEEGPSVLRLAAVRDAYDVRVRESGGELRLGEELLRECRPVGGCSDVEDLDRAGRAVGRAHGLEDRAHPAVSGDTRDHVLSDALHEEKYIIIGL